MEYANSTAQIMAGVSEERERRVVAHETRVTKSGRRLHYELTVIQQPMKARACGSGPKSSADRRPVDPPPVLQFYVYEETPTGRHDITFDYNADFFVYASLEHARPIAHPRGQTSTPAVLCGFPVAGCCYFDRPHPAAYFVFPDLSVRHEGRYRLVFELYEQPKSDADEVVDNHEDDGQGFYHRLEIRSEDFTVFSAKKFPGLSQSTTLSRTVAEQGCRVRIRRDVRMRRRDGKPGEKNSDPNNNPEISAPAKPVDVRARSASNSSVDAPYEYHQRLGSSGEYAAPHWGAKPPNTLDFGGHNAASGFATPSFPAPSQSIGTASHAASPMQSYGTSPRNSMYPPPPSPTYSKEPYSNTPLTPSSVPDVDHRRQSVGSVATPSLKPMPIAPKLVPNNGMVTKLPPLSVANNYSRREPMIAPRPDTSYKPHNLPSQSPYILPAPQSKKRAINSTFESDSDARNVQGNRNDGISYQDMMTAEVPRAGGGVSYFSMIGQ